MPFRFMSSWPDMREAVTKCKGVDLILVIWSSTLFCYEFVLVILVFTRRT